MRIFRMYVIDPRPSCSRSIDLQLRLQAADVVRELDDRLEEAVVERPDLDGVVRAVALGGGVSEPVMLTIMRMALPGGRRYLLAACLGVAGRRTGHRRELGFTGGLLVAAARQIPGAPPGPT
jgi:hypothetical protein